MKKMILFAVSLLAAGLLPAQNVPTAVDQVPIEEYVPKVIIEGKWGAGPGEFGYDGFNPVDFSPNSAVFGPDDLIHPRSLAVDSKGNICILDVANNRIQKFNKNGKHLADLKVDSWSGYELDPEKGWWYKVRGINIVIDSKDNLYYYLKRVKDGKESGEVWQLRNDKLVKKTVVPSVTGGLSYYDGILWITEYPYELVITDIGSDFNVFEGKKYPRKEVNRLRKQKMAASIRTSENNRARYVSRAGSKEEVRLEPVPGEEFVSPGTIRDSKALVVSLRGEEKILNEYGLSGKLLRRLRAESRPRNGFRDSQDNFYIISTGNSGVKVTKYSRKVVR